MSVRRGKVLSLAQVNHENKSREELKGLFKKVLNNGMHGICFSPYEEGQKPGDVITEEQIRRRMKMITIRNQRLVVKNQSQLSPNSERNNSKEKSNKRSF